MEEIPPTKNDFIQILRQNATKNQYGVSKVPFHTHNGTDSPPINPNNVVGNLQTLNASINVGKSNPPKKGQVLVATDPTHATWQTLPFPTSSTLPLSTNDWLFDGNFYPASNVQVNWTAGNLQFSNGTVYAISLGNTSTMSTVTYIYFDSSVSTTAFQIGVPVTFGGPSIGGSAYGITFSPDGKYIYVSGAGLRTKKYDLNFKVLATNSSHGASATVSVPNIASDSNYLYIADGTKVYKLNTSDLTVSISASITLDGVIISPNGTYLYGIDHNNSLLYKLNTSDLSQAVTSVSTGTGPNSLGVSPDGTKVYVSTTGGGAGALQVFTASNLAGGTFTNTTGTAASGLAVSPNGTNIYVTSLPGTVDKFNTSIAVTNTTTLSGGSQPFGITVSPNNSFVYVVDHAATKFYKLNASDLSEVTHVSVPTAPVAVIASSDGNFVYVTTSDSTIRKYNTADLSLVQIAPFVLDKTAILIGVAQNVSSGKNAVFQIFGGDALGGLGKLVTANDLAPSLGATGTFLDGSGNTVHVTNGIITALM